VSGGPSRTALVVVVDAAEKVVAPWRWRYNRQAVERRLPAHVTILFPLVPAATVDDGLLDELRALYAPQPPFSYALASVESFPGVVWLAPQPSGPFHDLIARTRAAFPDHPPYGDPALAPVPHCTIGVADDVVRLRAMSEKLEAGLGPSLPIICEASSVCLLEERGDGTWSARASFPFQGVS
jgi:2'-5' RNA ligase